LPHRRRPPRRPRRTSDMRTRSAGRTDRRTVRGIEGGAARWTCRFCGGRHRGLRRAVHAEDRGQAPAKDRLSTQACVGRSPRTNVRGTRPPRRSTRPDSRPGTQRRRLSFRRPSTSRPIDAPRSKWVALPSFLRDNDALHARSLPGDVLLEVAKVARSDVEVHDGGLLVQVDNRFARLPFHRNPCTTHPLGVP